MVRHNPPKHGGSAPGKSLITGIIGSVSSVVALFGKRVSGNPRTGAEPPPPRARANRLMNLASFGNRMSPLTHNRRKESRSLAAAAEDGGGGYGDGGVWQRGILMGDRCQPLEFSGAIYYDNDGKQLSELPPRSPRASPFSSHDRRLR